MFIISSVLIDSTFCFQQGEGGWSEYCQSILIKIDVCIVNTTWHRVFSPHGLGEQGEGSWARAAPTSTTINTRVIVITSAN